MMIGESHRFKGVDSRFFEHMDEVRRPRDGGENDMPIGRSIRKQDRSHFREADLSAYRPSPGALAHQLPPRRLTPPPLFLANSPHTRPPQRRQSLAQIPRRQQRIVEILLR